MADDGVLIEEWAGELLIVARLIRFSGEAVAKANGLNWAFKSQLVDPKPGGQPMARVNLL